MTNYFELYDLPVTFHPDAVAVKNKFYELSRKYHPDRFAQGDENARTESLQMASMNNDAYKVLGNEDKTMAYILKINGLLEEEEKYSLPPTFLMEMMDLNEAISDYEADPDNETAKQQAAASLQDQLVQWNEEVKALTNNAEGGLSSDDLLKIKDYYFRKKYLLRIQERIDKFAAR